MKKLKKKVSEWYTINAGVQALKSVSMPVVPAYRLSRLAKKIEAEIAIVDPKRLEIVKKYAQKDDKGEMKTLANGSVELIPDQLTEYQAEMKPLMDEEVEIEFQPIALASLGDSNVTPAALQALDEVVEE
jgi:hypothetical protein